MNRRRSSANEGGKSDEESVDGEEAEAEDVVDAVDEADEEEDDEVGVTRIWFRLSITLLSQ